MPVSPRKRKTCTTPTTSFVRLRPRKRPRSHLSTTTSPSSPHSPSSSRTISIASAAASSLDALQTAILHHLFRQPGHPYLPSPSSALPTTPVTPRTAPHRRRPDPTPPSTPISPTSRTHLPSPPASPLPVPSPPPPPSPPPLLTPRAREVVVDWMAELCAQYRTRPHTLALAVGYLDGVLTLDSPCARRSRLQETAAACVLIACKVEEAEAPPVADLAFLCDGLPRAELLKAERAVIGALAFQLTWQTAAGVVCFLANVCCKCPLAPTVAQFASVVMLLDAKAAALPPGRAAAACVSVAMAATVSNELSDEKAAQVARQHCWVDVDGFDEAVLAFVRAWERARRADRNGAVLFAAWREQADLLESRRGALVLLLAESHRVLKSR